MAERKFTYVVQRDVWTAEGKRVRKGTEAELTAEQAQDGVESGALKRLKEETPSEQPGQAE